MTCILFLALLLTFVKADNPGKCRLLFPKRLREEASLPGARFGRSAGTVRVINTDLLWPKNTVPYMFDRGFPSASVNLFLKAARHIMSRTCIRFRPYGLEDGPRKLHVIEHESEDRTFVGYQGVGEGQSIFFSANNANLRTYIHLLVHVIGFDHEHQRPDRDRFVTVHEDNILPIYGFKETNFDKRNGNCASLFQVPYDYKSIMHYSRHAGAINSSYDTITPMSPDPTIGFGESLSDFDVKKINNMYCSGTMGIRFRNVANGTYMAHFGIVTGWEKGLVSANSWADTHNRKWTVNWRDLKDSSRGSSILTSGEDSSIERLTFFNDGRPAGYVISENYTDNYDNYGDVHKWWIQLNSNSSWQIVNKENGTCIWSYSENAVLRTHQCNESDPRQLWNIYHA